jgi:outer membrane protein OmpA-like peptidoglycan-associated protein
MLTDENVEFAPRKRFVDRLDKATEARLGKIHDAMVAECRRQVARLVNEGYGQRLAAARDLRITIPFSPRIEIELAEGADVDTYLQEHAGDLYAEIEDEVRQALTKHFAIEVERRSYAFIFSGKDAYGRTAEAYLRQWFPTYRLKWAFSFEEMFETIAADLAKDRKSGRPVRIQEIVLVTHGYAGGLLIPLTKEDRKKEAAFRQWRSQHENTDLTKYTKERGHFTPEYLAQVQKDQTKATVALRRARREVLAALDDGAEIVVRGCNFGQSTEGLRALRDFFGGHAQTAAPVGYQGFETTYVRRDHPVPELRNEVSAYNFLVKHGYLDADPTLTDKEKEKIIKERFKGRIPVEFFTFGKEHHDAAKKALGNRPPAQRSAFAEELDPYVVTPAEIKGDTGPYRPLEQARDKEYVIRDPQARPGAVWGVVSRTPRVDAEIDRMSYDELVGKAEALQGRHYHPKNASLLVRLHTVWLRKSASSSWGPEDPRTVSLPKQTLEQYIFPDRKRFEADAALAPSPLEDDRFEKGALKYGTRDEQARAAAEQEGESARKQVEVTARPSVAQPSVATGQGFDARGRVDFPSGGLRLWNFAMNSAELRPEFRQPLLDLAREIEGKTDVILRIEGHASTAGAAAQNEKLAALRAQEVFELLQAAGVPPHRMDARGLGERRPLVPETGGRIAEKMARNRRVEIRRVKAAAPSAKPSGAPPVQAPTKAGTEPKGSVKAEPGREPITLLDAVEYKKERKWTLASQKRGVVLITVEAKLAFNGRFGLRGSKKILKLNPAEKKKAFEAAVDTDLGRMRLEGEVQDGKPSKIKVGFALHELVDLDFAANGDLTKPFGMEIKGKPLTQSITFGDWEFRGQITVTLVISFGPDPAAIAQLVKRGGRAIVNIASRAAAAAEGLLVTEIGAVTTFGAVMVGTGVAAIGIAAIGGVLVMIGRANIEAARRKAAYKFAGGYALMLMQLTAGSERSVMKETVAKKLSSNWRAELKRKWDRAVDNEDEAALNALYRLGEAAAAQEYDTYVRVYGDEQWDKLADAHRKKYGANPTNFGANPMGPRYGFYYRTVTQQLLDKEATIGIPLEINL